MAIHVRAPKPKLKHPKPTPAAPSILARYPQVQPQCHWFECLELQRSWGMPEAQSPKSGGATPPPLTHENRSRTKSLLCGPQSIFTAPSPWWQYTFAHQTPKSNTQNQHQPRHQFWKERKRLKSPPTHWSRAIAPEIQTLETK